MRELLRLVYDRLGECPRTSGVEWGDPQGLVPRLRQAVEDVLAAGLFDGRMTDIDMRQLPPAL